MKEEGFLKGAIVLTIATFFIKILGFIYVIPFVNIVGEEKYILFEYAYKPYVIFLSIATLGIPTAIAKYIAKNKELGNEDYVERVIQSGLKVMSLMGIVTFLIMYSMAEPLAKIVVGENSLTGNTLEEVVYVMRMVSYALLVIPIIALLRGVLQGHKLMTPTAYSQVWEQIVRIAVILLGSYIVIYVFNGEKSTAVGIATFAAFIGGIAGIVPLLHYTKKLKIKWFRKKKNTEINTKKMYKEIVWYAMPIILVGLSITIFQTIDTYSINNFLILKGKTLAEAELINSIVSLVQKIIVIPLAIATALSISLIPYVTKSYENKNNEEIRSWINKAVGANYLVVLPATVGLVLLGGPIYASIFGIEYAKLGGEITLYFALAALMFSMYTITAAILQGMHKNKVLIVSLIIGITLKLITNYPLVLFFEGGGTALSTYIAFFVMNLIQMAEIQKQARYNWTENTKKFKNIFTATLVTTIVLLPFSILALSSGSYLENVILTILAVGVSGLSYVFVLVKTKEIQKYIPEEKLNKITKKILRK